MARHTGWLACAGVLAMLSGCVERRFIVNTEPSGAKVYVNGKAMGFSPVDVPFTYYGTYLITLEYPGYQTKHLEQRVRAPWYVIPTGDFIVESLYPGKVSDVQQFDYTLDPMPRPNLDELLQEADDLRRRGKELPEPKLPVPPRNRDAAPPMNDPRNRGVLPPPEAVPPRADPIP